MSEPARKSAGFASHGTDAPVNDAATLESIVALDREREGGPLRNLVCMPNLVGDTFGGQIVAHAVMAVLADHPDRAPHSITLSFLEAGHDRSAHFARTTQIRSGNRIAHHGVEIEQDGRPLASAMVTTHPAELAEGARRFDRAAPMPDLPPPEAALPREDMADDAVESAVFGGSIRRGFPLFEIRGTRRGPEELGPQFSRSNYWLRMQHSRGLAPQLHYGLLSLASDFWYGMPVHRFVATPGKPLPGFVVSSLEHSLHFHSAPFVGDWLHFQIETTGVALGICHSRLDVWTRDGVPVASATQQGLMRSFRPAAAAS